MSASLWRAPVLGALLTAVCSLPLLPACGRSQPGDFSDFPDDGSAAGNNGAQSNGGTGSGGKSLGKGGTGVATGGKTGQGGSGIATGGTAVVGGSSSVGGAVGTGGTIGTGGAIGTGGTAPMGGKASGGASMGGAPAGGAAGAPATPIACGAATCDPDTQTCCAGFAGVGCIDKGAMCNGAVLECTSAAHCSDGDVCCLSLLGPTGVGTECRRTCNAMGPGRDQQLCSSDDECPNQRPRCQQTAFGVGLCVRR